AGGLDRAQVLRAHGAAVKLGARALALRDRLCQHRVRRHGVVEGDEDRVRLRGAELSVRIQTEYCGSLHEVLGCAAEGNEQVMIIGIDGRGATAWGGGG